MTNDANYLSEEVLDKISKVLSRVLDNPPPTTTRSLVIKGLNSPIILTLLGGAFVSLLTLFWQDRNAQIQNERERERQLLDRKQTLMAEFANQIVPSMNYALNFRERECWLIAN